MNKSEVPHLDAKVFFLQQHELAQCGGHLGTGISIIRCVSALQYHHVVGKIRNTRPVK